MTRHGYKVVLGLMALVLGVAASSAETLTGSTVESRILLGFKVNDAAAQDLLPQGWTPVTLPKGPVGGSNLIVALFDRHTILDAEGAPKNPASGPTVAFLSYGRNSDVEGVRAFVSWVYEEPPVENPFGNSVAADISRVSGFTDEGGGVRSQTETWTIAPEAGGSLQLELDFKVGGLRWSTGGESRPHSSVDPDFSRIYRFDQLAGLAMNTAMGVKLDGTASFSASDPALPALFDGSEELTAIVSIPVYLRQVFIP
ncbi:MAG: hypothetical protein HKN63_04675 [Rhodobacteraceae bacterium]|nr:hypothetical protein [Paracoccaceae bacterium]